MTIENQFHDALLDAIRDCNEIGYQPTVWQGMIDDLGAVDAAKRRLESNRPWSGFERLSKEQRLDLSVEFVVLLPEFKALFNPRERGTARTRLVAEGFDVDGHLKQHRLAKA